jgi:hypothetical protein
MIAIASSTRSAVTSAASTSSRNQRHHQTHPDVSAGQDHLAGVGHQALEPAHVSVWISQRD